MLHHTDRDCHNKETAGNEEDNLVFQYAKSKKFNDPGVIKLGPPGAARKLLFNSPDCGKKPGVLSSERKAKLVAENVGEGLSPVLRAKSVDSISQKSQKQDELFTHTIQPESELNPTTHKSTAAFNARSQNLTVNTSEQQQTEMMEGIEILPNP
uniref:Uncharacterized protein n=1 Tax=Chenopodium quinoa TaxID=63459 RepID=A0A803MXG5_CHEQI